LTLGALQCGLKNFLDSPSVNVWGVEPTENPFVDLNNNELESWLGYASPLLFIIEV